MTCDLSSFFLSFSKKKFLSFLTSKDLKAPTFLLFFYLHFRGCFRCDLLICVTFWGTLFLFFFSVSHKNREREREKTKEERLRERERKRKKRRRKPEKRKSAYRKRNKRFIPFNSTNTITRRKPSSTTRGHNSFSPFSLSHSSFPLSLILFLLPSEISSFGSNLISFFLFLFIVFPFQVATSLTRRRREMDEKEKEWMKMKGKGEWWAWKGKRKEFKVKQNISSSFPCSFLFFSSIILFPFFPLLFLPFSSSLSWSLLPASHRFVIPCVHSFMETSVGTDVDTKRQLIFSPFHGSLTHSCPPFLLSLFFPFSFIPFIFCSNITMEKKEGWRERMNGLKKRIEKTKMTLDTEEWRERHTDRRVGHSYSLRNIVIRGNRLRKFAREKEREKETTFMISLCRFSHTICVYICLTRNRKSGQTFEQVNLNVQSKRSI